MSKTDKTDPFVVQLANMKFTFRHFCGGAVGVEGFNPCKCELVAAGVLDDNGNTVDVEKYIHQFGFTRMSSFSCAMDMDPYHWRVWVRMDPTYKDLRRLRRKENRKARAAARKKLRRMVVEDDYDVPCYQPRNSARYLCY